MDIIKVGHPTVVAPTADCIHTFVVVVERGKNWQREGFVISNMNGLGDSNPTYVTKCMSWESYKKTCAPHVLPGVHEMGKIGTIKGKGNAEKTAKHVLSVINPFLPKTYSMLGSNCWLVAEVTQKHLGKL
jgi:hypothetical protein